MVLPSVLPSVPGVGPSDPEAAAAVAVARATASCNRSSDGGSKVLSMFAKSSAPREAYKPSCSNSCAPASS